MVERNFSSGGKSDRKGFGGGQRRGSRGNKNEAQGERRRQAHNETAKRDDFKRGRASSAGSKSREGGFRERQALNGESRGKRHNGDYRDSESRGGYRSAHSRKRASGRFDEARGEQKHEGSKKAHSAKDSKFERSSAHGAADRSGGYKQENRRDSNRGNRSYGHDNRSQQQNGERSYGAGKRSRVSQSVREQQPRFGRGGTRGQGKSDRGGKERQYSEAERIAHELRPVRQAHIDPEIPAEIEAKQLHPAARNELKTLEKDNAERVAKHLVMAGELIHLDPELAHQHAISASRRAGRIPVARETLAITAYALEDFAMALRELRTYRRLTGRDNHIALMVDCERGLGRPERGLEIAHEANLADLTQEERVQLAIAISGARLDLEQHEQALAELEIPELNPHKAYPWSPELFAAYAYVLSVLGQSAESAKWEQLAQRAANLLHEHAGGDQLIVTDTMASPQELAERGIELADDSAEGVTNVKTAKNTLREVAAVQHTAVAVETSVSGDPLQPAKTDKQASADKSATESAEKAEQTAQSRSAQETESA